MNDSIAVVLFQLGGPDSAEAVEPFLYNLFLDPDIIDFPLARLTREPLARLISSRRSRNVVEKYKEIGGKSPILELTQQQAAVLEKELQNDLNAKVYIAMRYWHPMTEATVRQVQRDNPRRIVLLPLYPQYSRTTTGSSLNEWNRWCSALGLDTTEQRIVYQFHDHPLDIQSLIERINETLESHWTRARARVTLVFSAHGVPMSVIRSGDPYRDHIEKTVELVMKEGGWENQHTVCYQSKVGPAKWLRPSLVETIALLGQEEKRDILVVPVSFVTDHIETLHEIDIEAREFAAKVGVTNFVMTPGLNTHPAFIRALGDLVRKAAA